MWSSQDTTVGALQPLMASLQKHLLAGGSTHASELIHHELVMSLVECLLKEAVDERLTIHKARLVAVLLPCTSNRLQKAVLPASAGVARLFSGDAGTVPNMKEDNPDVVLLTALHSAGLLSMHELVHYILQEGMAEHAVAAKDALMRPNHTLFSFADEFVALHASPAFLSEAAQLLSLVTAARTVPCVAVEASDASYTAENAVDVLLLLSLAATLKQPTDSCARLLENEGLLQKQHAEHFLSQRGLLYMLSVVLRAASAKATCAVGAAQSIVRCAALCCYVSREVKTGTTEVQAALVAFNQEVIPVIFQLAAGVLVTTPQKVSMEEYILQNEAAALWKRIDSTLQADARSGSELSRAVAPQLMTILLQYFTAEATSWVNFNAMPAQESLEGDTDMPEMVPACSVAARYVPAVEIVLQVAGLGGATMTTVLSYLFESAFAESGGGQENLWRRLLVWATLLQLEDRSNFEAAVPFITKHAIEMISGSESVAHLACNLLRAVLSRARGMLSIPAADSLLLSVLTILWSHSFEKGQYTADSLAAVALREVLAGLPAAAANAVCEFFGTITKDAAQATCTDDADAAAHASRTVQVLASHVHIHLRTTTSKAARDTRDAYSATVLKWLCKRAPVLSRQPTADSEDVVSVEASAMLAVASLYIQQDQQQSEDEQKRAAKEVISLLSQRTACLKKNDDSAADDAHADLSDLLNAPPRSADEHANSELQETLCDGKAAGLGATVRSSDTCKAVQQMEQKATDDIAECFLAAVAHQLRVVPAAALHQVGDRVQVGEHEALQSLLICAHSMAATQLTSNNLERMVRYLENCVSGAAVAMEQRCEAVCGALLDAVRAVAGPGDDAEPTNSAELAIQLSCRQPVLARAKLLPAVQEALQVQQSASSVLQPTVCELFAQMATVCHAQQPGSQTAAFQRVEALFVRILLCCGACMHVASVVQPGCEVHLVAWVPGSAHFWHATGKCVLMHVQDSCIKKAICEYMTWAESEIGVPALHAAIGLLQCQHAAASVHAAATRISLHPSVLCEVVHRSNDEYDSSGSAHGYLMFMLCECIVAWSVYV
jgi:hypothetical protein